MKKIAMELALLATTAACAQIIVLPENDTVGREIKIEEGQSVVVNGTKITPIGFADAILMGEDGIPGDKTMFRIRLESGFQNKEFDAEYGTEISEFGISIKVKWCTSGTRDFKSFTELIVKPMKK